MSNLVNVREHSGLVVDSDWGPAFAAAIDEAVTSGKRGVFVPADAADYTVRKPAPQTPSIDLRGRRNFILLGEGDSSRIRLLGSGLGGSWNLIMIGGNCVDITVRSLYLDGDQDHLTDLDNGQHTHTIQVGGMNTGGFAHRVRILDCTMTDMDGDGVAIAALAGPFGGGDEVSVVDIIGCKFLNCRRSGVSNQRSAEFVRIHDCYFEGTRNQDIDFEPTSVELGSGPRRYSIIGNTMIRSTNVASVTLSGAGGDIPAKDNIFAHNHIYGGRVGMVNTEHVLILGNYIESGVIDTEAVLQLRGKSEGAAINHNHILRAPGAAAGKAVNISSREQRFSLKGFDHIDDTITATSHGQLTGMGPVTLATSGTLPTGLDPTIDYWLIRIDDDTLRLATSEANAGAGTFVTFSDNGIGRHTLILPTSIIRLRGFDHTSDTLTLPSHARNTGAGPVSLTTSGALPTGLDPTISYWLIRIDADTLSLATNKENADAGTAVSFSDGGTGDHALELIDYPRGVDVSHNRIQSHSAPDADSCTVLVTNAQECSFADNEVSSYFGGVVTDGVRFETSKALGETAEDWNISNNRIRGDAGGGEYTHGIALSPIGVAARGIKVNGNAFRGCASRVGWNAGFYGDIPTAQANTGQGDDFENLGNVVAVCIGGNAGSQADYIYETGDSAGAPLFAASNGSTARRRTDGNAGPTIYFREAGMWVGK